MDKNETNVQLDNITGALQRLIEKSQVKASLLNLESREAWQDVGKAFTNIQKFLKKDWGETQEDMGEAQLQLHLGMMEAREGWNDFKKECSSDLNNLNAGRRFDNTLLKAHLGKMEATDRYKAKRNQWKETYLSSVKPQLKESMEKMKRDMATMAKSMVD